MVEYVDLKSGERLVYDVGPEPAIFGPGPLKRAFHTDAIELVGDRVRASEDDAAAFWGSLANVVWHRDGIAFMYSFREAGHMIADDIRQSGSYADWYCAGEDGRVVAWVEEALGARGWKHGRAKL